MKKMFILCWLSIFLIGCATTSKFGESGSKNCIVDECIIIGGVQYRIVGAPSAAIKTYGRKAKIDEILWLPFTGDWTYERNGIFVGDISVDQVRLIDFSFDQGIELKKSGIKLTPEVKTLLDGKWTDTGSYKLVVVEYDNPAEVIKEAIKTAHSDSQFKTEITSKHFRIITSVVYLLNYEQTKKISGGIDGKMKATISGEDVEIILNIEGHGDTTLKLPGKQRVAYQYRRVCWKDEKPVTMIIDYINRFGGGDGKDCKKYGASSIYPG